MKTEFDLSGERGVQKALDTLRKDAPKAFAGALHQNAMDIRRVSAQKTPVDTGHLRRSWVATSPDIQEFEISVIIGYTAHYALWVHERTEVSHDPGEAKFLEKAINEEAADFDIKLAKRAMRLLEREDYTVPGQQSGPDATPGRL